MNIIQWLAHSIEEYDQLKLLTSLGHTVFSPGAYIKPRTPADDKRPALDIDPVTDMLAIVDALGQPNHSPHGRCDGRDGHNDPVTAVKLDTPDEMIEWADCFIVHHLEHTWLAPQWDRLKHKRVIWRTVGQSGDRNEAMMAPLHAQGMQIVRYSPKEKNIPHFAGQDALIRFYKDPTEWQGWHGSVPLIGNVTQSLYQRSLADDGMLQNPGWQWTSYGFWQKATHQLPVQPAGPGSEVIGGIGSLDYDEMRAYLQAIRAYCYTGTQPASYTLGLIEAMMTGVPVVSLTPEWFRILPYGSGMFEGHEIAPLAGSPEFAHEHLRRMLAEPAYAAEIGAESRSRALELFGRDKIAAQWQAFLEGAVVPENVKELVAA